jgi:hypothetical protein
MLEDMLFIFEIKYDSVSLAPRPVLDIAGLGRIPNRMQDHNTSKNSSGGLSTIEANDKTSPFKAAVST